MLATTETVSVAALKAKASLVEDAAMTSGFVRTTSWQSSGKRVSTLARVSCDDQINSLDVTKAAQLLVAFIAPTFADVSDGA